MRGSKMANTLNGDSNKGVSSGERKSDINKEKKSEYEVEQVVDMKVNPRWKCPVKFRVRWVGYSEKDDSWLPTSKIDCNQLINDFLEISGRKSEYSRALEEKKKADEEVRELRHSISRPLSYSELDKDDDEVLPSGTKTRKPKMKREVISSPRSSNKNKKVKAAAAVSSTPASKEEIFEVQRIIDDKVTNGITYYLVRWKGYSSKDDSWLPECDLNCPKIVTAYKKYMEEQPMDDEDDHEVEKIVDSRTCKKTGNREYLVRWKGFKPSQDTWEPEQNLDHCKDILKTFNSEHQDRNDVKSKEKAVVVRSERSRRSRSVNKTSFIEDQDEENDD